MGDAIGGDLLSVFVVRPDGQSRSFGVATGGDNSRIMGGRYNDDSEANGNGGVRDIIRTRPGEREVVLNCDDAIQDHEWILEASAALAKSTVIYTHSNGSVYSHKAKPTGDLSKNDGNGTVTVVFKGTQIKRDV